MAHIDDETLTVDEEEEQPGEGTQAKTECEPADDARCIDADEVNDDVYADDVDDDDVPAVRPAPVRDYERDLG